MKIIIDLALTTVQEVRRALRTEEGPTERMEDEMRVAVQDAILAGPDTGLVISPNLRVDIESLCYDIIESEHDLDPNPDVGSANNCDHKDKSCASDLAHRAAVIRETLAGKRKG